MLILASSSPQRRELLSEIEIPFKIHHPNFEEINNETLTPEENAKMLALGKAKSVSHYFPNNWVLGVDTIVVCDNQIIGKAKNKAEARETIKLLRGKTHSVISGIALIKDDQQIIESDITKITFGEMTDEEVENFLDTDEWIGKSGAFTIKKHGSLFIKRIEGDYYNVVGLPLYRLGQMLKKIKMPFFQT